MVNRCMLCVCLLLCTAVTASAIQIRNHCEEEEGIKSESGIFEEDYLFLGHALNFSGQAEDLVFLGEELTFSGETRLGLTALCKRLVYTGVSGNGVMAACGDLAVDGRIDGTSYVGCKSLHVSERAVVNGNMFVGCAKLAIDGIVNGDLYAGAGEVIINREVNGNVVAYGGRVIIGDEGRINGNLTYSAKEPLSDEELSRISGTVEVKEGFDFDKDRLFPENMGKTVEAAIFVGFFISFVVVGSLLLFIPVFRRIDDTQSGNTFWATALWGLIPLLMYPGIIVLSLVLIVTIPFALVLLLAFVPLLFLAHVIGTTLVGRYVTQKFKWNVRKRHYHFLIGALAGAIVSWIPIVNALMFLLISALGWGMYIRFLFNRQLPAAE